VDTYDWLLALHVTGAFLFIGGAVAAGTLSLLARRAERPSEVGLLLGLAVIPVAAVGLGLLMTIVFGLWLVFHLDAYGIFDGWVIASILLWILAVALGGRGGRQERETRLQAERLAAAGDAPSPELRARVISPLSWASGVVGLIILALMIWKPGA
jgi:uncharacterized membrane protein